MTLSNVRRTPPGECVLHTRTRGGSEQQASATNEDEKDEEIQQI